MLILKPILIYKYLREKGVVMELGYTAPAKKPAYIPQKVYNKQTSNGPAQYTSSLAVRELLHELMADLKLSKYQLGRMLGTTQGAHVYRWLTGTYRPGPLYLMRLLKICHMKITGHPVADISYIDWDNSVIKWRDGNVTHNNHLSGGGGAVQTPERQSRREMAVIPNQPARPDGAHS